MRYLILADLHANLEALRAVLAEVDLSELDAVLLLGDLVGYGADPNETVRTVQELSPPVYAVRGNHDKAACRLDEGIGFHDAARAAVEWTGRTLTAENLSYLEGLAAGPLEVGEEVSICHGSPRDEDEYLLSELDAEEIFGVQTVPVVFFGHTHLPTLFRRSSTGLEASLVEDDSLQLEVADGDLHLLNPGAVGQPRDQDPRAAFMTYDSDSRKAAWRRVAYPVAEAQRKILEAGLPPVLARRLALGM